MSKLNSGCFKKGYVPANKRDWTEIDKVIINEYPSKGGIYLASNLDESLHMIHLRASKLGVKCLRKQILTEETKKKISKSMKGRIKSEEWCKNLSISLKGRKHSLERKQAIIKGLIRSRKERRTMTKPEKIIYNILVANYGQYNPFEYTGNRKYWIKLNDTYKNPDFVSVFYNKIIEVFGRYWHKEDESKIIIKAYKEEGWDCMVIWEDEININTRDEIMEFVYPYEYEAELKEEFI